jgi:hypothetical protein
MFSSNHSNVVATAANYIEDVFSTYLYTGTSANRSIINNIDLAGKGGLVWIKTRSETWEHYLADTVRGTSKSLATNNTSPESTGLTNAITSFNSNGFSLGIDTDLEAVNRSPKTYVSWTFREQPKFFDVVTISYTGSAITVNHALGSVPGCIIIKLTTGIDNWYVYHRSVTGTDSTGALNSTLGFASPNGYSNFASSITSTSFTFNAGFTSGTYVAYIFAHDAGGFGLTGTDNVISCGSFTATGSAQTVTLGYEPQWVLVKSSNNVDNWYILDNMRGLPVSEQAQRLYANTSSAEGVSATLAPTATGFSFSNTSNFANAGYTYIYIAIRRGPMAVPTTGTSVFTPATRTGTSATANITSAGFPVDLTLIGRRNTDGLVTVWDRLRGATNRLITSNTNAESSSANGLTNFDSMTGFTLGNNNTVNDSTYNYVDWDFRRAPSFFDIVCYTCNNQASAITSNHNLNVIPEMMIAKKRAVSGDWSVYHKGLNGGVTPQNYRIRLNATNAAGAASGIWNNTAPTSTQFTVGTDGDVNSGTGGAVVYLFATCAGVSKVGSYTGTAATLQIDCGFTGGARFVLIKRTDSDGDWYVWDSARGIVAGNDPYLLLNSTAAEVTNTDYVDTYSAGFEISSTAPAAINANGGSFIFFAVA